MSSGTLRIDLYGDVSIKFGDRDITGQLSKNPSG